MQPAPLHLLFPPGVVHATADDDLQDRLYPEEEAAVARAIERRRAEFAAGRACAREALRRLGAPAAAIPVRSDRAPVWPEAVVGSITHCEGFVAAAVAWKRDFDGIGLDAESAAPLEPNLVRLICTPAEVERLREIPPPAGTDWPKLAFSAKEAVHKAVAPSSGITLGFHDVEIDFDADRTFRATLVGRTDPRLPDFDRLDGRWIVTDRLVVTGLVLHRPDAR